MRFSQIEELLNVPYSPENMDCADFVLLVQEKLFNRTVGLAVRPRGWRMFLQLKQISAQHAERTENPVDGDLVLMYECGQHRSGHVGVYLILDHQPYVLHNTSGDGCSSVIRLRDLAINGLRFEGFYKWRTV